MTANTGKATLHDSPWRQGRSLSPYPLPVGEGDTLKACGLGSLLTD